MAAAFQTTPEAQAPAYCFRCDCCHTALGSRFTDHYWACEDCSAWILSDLLREAYPLGDLLKEAYD